MDSILSNLDAVLSSAVSELMRLWSGAGFWDVAGVGLLAVIMLLIPRYALQRRMGQLLNIAMILMVLAAAYLCIHVLLDIA